jgi:serine O-acetyltransferase
MITDFAMLWVRLRGGFWRYRERMRKARPGSVSAESKRVIYHLYLNSYGAYIAPTAQFASEPCFPHGLHGVFVAGGASVGRNCVMFQQVTLGANSLPGSRAVGCPRLGDNVYVGAGAKIIGSVTVGDNCRIGANCVVTRDVPPNTTVVLAEPRLITRTEPQDNRYFRWSPQGPQFFAEGEWRLEKDPAVIEKLRDAF